jgi:hypothetical protein
MPSPCEPSVTASALAAAAASRCATALALLVVLSGCGSTAIDPTPSSAAPVLSAPVVVSAPAAPPVDVATPMDAVSRRLLAHHEQLRLMSAADLAQEINRVAALAPGPDASLQLAMALLQTRNGGELNRAIGLVDPIAKSAAPEQRPWQPFARLLLSRLQELRRLEDLLDRRNQELRDSQREVKQLNEKLEALKAIERSLAPAAGLPLVPSPSPTPTPATTAAPAAPASTVPPSAAAVPSASNGAISPGAPVASGAATPAAPPARRSP